MKKIIKYILILCLFLEYGCEQHDALVYENDPRICFTRGDRGYGQQDSVVHSFFLVPSGQDRDTVWVEMSVMGCPDPENARSIKIVQSNAGAEGAAVAGTHYVAFDDPEIAEEMQVPVNAVKVKIPVILKRDPSLSKQRVRIEMTVEENEYFKPGIDKDKIFMVKTTAMADQPDNWKSWSYYFGEWGSVKMGFIVNYVGFSDFENIPDDINYRYYLQLKAREKLVEYNATHEEPLCEDVEKKHVVGEYCADCVVFP